METVDKVKQLLNVGLELKEIEAGIYVLDENLRAQEFDRLAKMYDRLIRSRLYNRIAWGTSPQAYEKFAQSVYRHQPQSILDAGCGSMAATAEVHSQSDGWVVGMDTSLPMLRLANQRLRALNAKNVLLLVGSVEDIPFKPGSFDSVLFMGMAHLFSDQSCVMDELKRVAKPSGHLYLSSLIQSRRTFGNSLLAKLKQKGEVHSIRTVEEFISFLKPPQKPDLQVEGNMLFVSTKPC